jgi:hypothetical protein
MAAMLEWFSEARVLVGFTLEAREPIRIVGERLGQCLDGDVAIQFRIAGAKDLPHSPFPDAGDHFEGAKAKAGGESQVWRHYTGERVARWRRWRSPPSADKEDRSSGPALRIRSIFPSKLPISGSARERVSCRRPSDTCSDLHRKA